MDFGIVEIDKDGMLVDYIEKPSYYYNFGMGVNILNVDHVRPFLTKGEYLDMPQLMLLLKESGLNVLSYQEDCFWLDMGRPDDYDEANKVFIERQSEFLP
jgi:NDP-sugar pyrophosphorylase family protein